MIVADASWVIALHYSDDLLHDRAIATFPETVGITTLLHPVTLAESLVGAARAGDADQSAVKLRASYTVPEVDHDAPVRWAELRARSGLRLPDAIVLDTAIHHRADTVATFDIRLAAAAREHGLEVLGASDND